MEPSASQIAIGLYRRLLNGERGQLPQHLAYLLDKASSLRDSDEFYRSVRPPELASLQISSKTRKKIVAELCAEVSRKPDEALISVMSSTGDDLSVRTAAVVLVNPPRPLTIRERCHLFGLLKGHLPACLQRMPDFIPRANLVSIIQMAKDLQHIDVEEGKSDGEKSERNVIKIFAEDLTSGLAQMGVSTT
jgi:hypothetical protein